MNRRQWIIFIVGVVCVFIFILAIAFNQSSNMFWTRQKYGYFFNSVPFSLLLFTVSGVFAFLIWAFRSKEQKSPEKDFTQKIKELAELKEKELISEEEFEKGKAKLFGEDG